MLTFHTGDDPPDEKSDASNGLDRILRIGEELTVKAAARSQSGKILESIPVTLTIHEDDDEAITLEDGVITAAGVGSAIVRAESEIAGISGDLNIDVTNPVDAIVFMKGEGDDATEVTDTIVLAAGQSYDAITAVAHDEDGEVVTPRSNWSWASSDGSVATVAQMKNADDELVMQGAIGTITGKGSGNAMISATVEGASGSVDVSVTGQTKTRRIAASTSDNGNTFTWDRGADSPAWDPANSSFQVTLYDIIAGDLLQAGTVNVASSNTDVATVGATATIENGVATVQVSPAPADPGDGTGNDDPAAGEYTTVVTLTSIGADPVRLLFTTVIKDVPATE